MIGNVVMAGNPGEPDGKRVSGQKEYIMPTDSKLFIADDLKSRFPKFANLLTLKLHSPYPYTYIISRVAFSHFLIILSSVRSLFYLENWSIIFWIKSVLFHLLLAFRTYHAIVLCSGIFLRIFCLLLLVFLVVFCFHSLLL